MTQEHKHQGSDKDFKEAPPESWWECQTASCRCAFQKEECPEPGVCPYCAGEAYNIKPWDVALYENPHYPVTPESGQTYWQKMG